MNINIARGPWPTGPGEMAERIRAHEWSATPLGPIEGWPQSLRTAVDMVLAMPSPATILWGPRHVQIYNDAYVPIARDRHASLLGCPVAQGWSDAYDTVIAPLLDAAHAGQATRLIDFSFPLKNHDGQVQERLFDTDWSPIRDESGGIAGVLQTLVETTDRFKTQTALRESDSRHRLLIGSWAQAIRETDPGGVVVADSPSWRAYTGQTLDEWLGYGWLNAIHPDDRAFAERQWREAIAARGLVNAEFRLRAPDGGWRWTNVRAAPVLDTQGQILKWAGMNIDIDRRKLAEEALRATEERHRAMLEQRMAEAIEEIKASRHLLEATLDASTDMIQVFEAIRDDAGDIVDFRWVLNNHTSESHYGEVRGESLLTRNPGVVAEGIFDAFRRVTETGVPEQAERHYVHEQFDGWFYQSVVKLNDGVATTTKEISDWKAAQAEVMRLKDEAAAATLQASEERFRSFAENSTDALWILDARTRRLAYLSPAFERIWGERRAVVLEDLSRWAELVHPEDRDRASAALPRALAGESV